VDVAVCPHCSLGRVRPFSYVQRILPPVKKMTAVPAFTIRSRRGGACQVLHSFKPLSSPTRTRRRSRRLVQRA